MKEFVEKLISRLEEEKKGHLNLYCDGLTKAISIVYQLAEEYKLFGNSEQVKVSEIPTGWIPCSSGEIPKCGEFDIKNVWVTMHRKGIDFYFTRKICWNNYLKCWEWRNGKKMADDWEVIAWMYVEVPAPYQPKGE